MNRFEICGVRLPEAPKHLPYRVNEEFLSYDKDPDIMGLMDRDFKAHYGHGFSENYRSVLFRPSKD